MGKRRKSEDDLPLFAYMERKKAEEQESAQESTESSQTEVSQLEESISMAEVPKLWNIRKKDLTDNLNRRRAEVLSYGIQNLRIPYEMMDVMNPDEILAKYSAAGRMKRYNRHVGAGLPRDFFELVREMDRVGYGEIGYMATRCKRRFSANRGEQIKRLQALDSSVQEAFVNAFFEPYRPSTREEPSNPNAFFDYPGGSSKKFYINEFYTFLKHEWEKSLQRD